MNQRKRLIYRKKDSKDNRDYEWFERTCRNIPSSIQTKLKNMPCNHGIIWKGIWLFGEGSEVPGPITMNTQFNVQRYYKDRIDMFGINNGKEYFLWSINRRRGRKGGKGGWRGGRGKKVY